MSADRIPVRRFGEATNHRARFRGSISPQWMGRGFVPDLWGWDVKTICLGFDTVFWALAMDAAVS